MKFQSYEYQGKAGWGALVDGRILVLDRRAPGIRAALAAGKLPRRKRDLPRKPYFLDPGEVLLLPPIPDPPRIFCVGLNYADHQAETGRKAGDYPVIFTRCPGSLVGDGRPVLSPMASTRFDYEGELAVVIATPGRRISEGDALDHVAGYSCFMDGSIRDYQSHGSQFTPGKNFDASGAFGPCLVTPDETGDPNAGLRLRSRLNGAVVQEATTDLMIFRVPRIIAYLSQFTCLLPGDVIATGTPGGVGNARTPPLFMKPGDRIEVDIERVGCLANPVRAEA